MVDCNLLDLSQIGEEQRRSIIEYVRERKGVKPKDLGVTDAYLRMIRNGKARAGDGLLCQALKYVTEDELKLLLKGIVPEARASLNDAVRVIATARVDPEFREFLLGLIKEYLGDYITTLQQTWHVDEKDIEDFIKAKRLKGLSDKTIRDEVHYIREALAELGWNLTPEGVREYLAGLAEDGEVYVLKHTTYSLKSFLKTVLKPKDPALFRSLYDVFTVYRPKTNNHTRLPTLEQLRQIWQGLPTIESKFYFALLTETGLRPGEPFLLSIDDLDLGHGMLRVGKVTPTKRAFIAFLRPEFLDWVRGNYLPHREAWVEKMGRAWLASKLFSQDVIENAKSKLIPFDQSRLRREIKETARQVLGRDFELYELRKFFATFMISQGVPESIVNTLQGRAPPSEFRVLVEHYWSPRHEELRQWYLKFAPRICC
ncbi:MAG: site-specific integrase [Vulcanisaeta sp.]|jgi:integrase|nr:site-specific integrase [Vulcanisaeta sp.]